MSWRSFLGGANLNPQKRDKMSLPGRFPGEEQGKHRDAQSIELTAAELPCRRSGFVLSGWAGCCARVAGRQPVIEQIKQVAHAKGMGYQTLIRMWVMEQVQKTAVP